MIAAVADIVIVPREREVLSLSASALRAWLERAFDARCEVHGAPAREGSRVKASVRLSTSGAHVEDQALLAARPNDQRLWKAWVEQACVAGWCDVVADVRVNDSPSGS
jgi:hypothetical protein